MLIQTDSPIEFAAFRIDTGDFGVNGGACSMHVVIFYSIRQLYVLGIIR